MATRNSFSCRHYKVYYKVSMKMEPFVFTEKPHFILVAEAGFEPAALGL